MNLLVQQSHAEGLLSGFQARLAERVMDLSARPVRDVMVPPERFIALPHDCTRGQFEQVLARHDCARLPVWRDGPENVVGIVNVHEVLCDPTPPARPRGTSGSRCGFVKNETSSAPCAPCSRHVSAWP